MKYIKHIILTVFAMGVMMGAWAQNANIIIPTRTGSDNLSWTFQMPTGKCVLRTTWKQNCGIAYAQSDLEQIIVWASPLPLRRLKIPTIVR